VIPGALAVVVAAVLAYGLLNAPPQTAPSGQADLPRIGSITAKQLPKTGPTPTPTATAAPSPSATATPSASATATTSP